MAIKILALDGLNDQKLCNLIVQLIQTIPSVRSANIDYMSQKLTLQISEEKQDIAKTIAEVSLTLKENIPGVTIKLSAVGEQAPKSQTNSLNFSKERAVLREKEEELLLDEQRLAEEKRIAEEEAQRLAKEAEMLILEQEIKALWDDEEEETPEEDVESPDTDVPEEKEEPALKIKKVLLKKEAKGHIFGVSIAAICFLLSLIFSSLSLFSLILQMAAFLLLAILTLTATSPKNNESSKLADMFAVFATGVLFFSGGYISAVLGILIYSIAALCISLTYDAFYYNLNTIIDIKPEKVICTRNGITELLSPNYVLPDDLVLIDIGQTIPFDGIVTEGSSHVDRSLFSGSRLPIAVSAGGIVKCGEINLEAQLTIRVEDYQAASLATRIFSMVTNSPLDNTKTAAELRKANTYFTLALTIAAIIGGFFAFDKFGFDGLLNYIPMFLIILMPCGAVSTANLCYLSTVGRALKQGIIITTSRYMDMLARAKTIVFGYTGVLTQDKYDFCEIVAGEEYNNEEVMEAAAYSEHSVNHPIAQKIVEKYTELYNKKVIPSKIGFCDVVWGGVKALVDSRITLVGSGKLMEDSTIEVPPNEDGRLNVYVARFGRYIGTVIYENPLVEDIEGVANELRSSGAARVGLLTGCDREVAQSVRQKLKFDAVYSEQTNSDKLATMLSLIEQPDMPVLFIGNEEDSEVFSPLCPSISMGNENLSTLLYFSAAIIPSNDVKQAVKAVKLSKSARNNAFISLGIYFLCKTALIVLALIFNMGFILALLIDVAAIVILTLTSTSIIKRR